MTAKLPFHGGQKCYACDSTKVVGFRDRRPDGGDLEVACKRHADPRILTYDACQYCNGPIRKGSVVIDGMFAHRKCHDEVCNDSFDRNVQAKEEQHAERTRARARDVAQAAPVELTLLLEDGQRLEIPACPTATLKTEHPFASAPLRAAIAKELELRGWALGLDGPRDVWTRTRAPDWQIVEHISGIWSYHVRDAAQPAAASQPSTCGKPVMTCPAPLSTWGFIGHLREKYCPICAARAELAQPKIRP